MDADRAAVYHLEGGRLIESAPDAYFSFLGECGHVISLVGGGGKTTIMHDLARRYAARGKKTAVTTTTKIGQPASFCRNMEDCRACWREGRFAVCGEPLGNGKLTAPAYLEQILDEADAVLIEADGARKLPCKAPAVHEPVIIPRTDIVIAVMGLDALGQAIDDCCLRSDHVQRILGCGGGHALTCEDMAALLLSEQGSRKDVGGRMYYTLLNKCDDAQRMEAGRRILTLLREAGHTRAALTAGMRRSEEFEFAAGR
ncbi:MAG: putative selenium-dependent hydroxylase accessory protein YqeC [Clostridia bacterium]|nr:putative selenium-dependent hydroxylase accessory protein YqeC [Clostridia bacterium]